MSSEAGYTPYLRVREYNPNGPPQSKPIRPEQWKRHERRIKSLHAAKYKRAEALEKLKAECGCEHNCSFNPSYVFNNLPSIFLYQCYQQYHRAEFQSSIVSEL